MAYNVLNKKVALDYRSKHKKYKSYDNFHIIYEMKLQIKNN